jgi:hypothetical protein
MVALPAVPGVEIPWALDTALAHWRAPISLQQNRLSDGSTNKETLVTDAWTNDDVQYTIDAKVGVGGVVTAQREGAKTAHSRIVLKLVTREETEKLFERDLSATKALAGRS